MTKTGMDRERADYQEMLQQIMKLTEQLQSFIQATVETQELHESDQHNLSPNEGSLGKPHCWQVLGCSKCDCPAYGIDDYRCWLIAGTLCGGTPEGTFAKKHKSCYSCSVYRQFTENAMDALYENVGIVIQHLGDVTQQLRWLAINDNLTGLYNRTYLKLIKKREIAAAARSEAPLSLVIFDLDGFKAVNDTYGHLAGDEMLRAFGRFLKQYSRNSDILFRLGGDEFMVLMGDTDEGQRRQAETRYLADIGQWNQQLGDELPVPICFTLGGATAVAPAGFKELMAEADRELYVTKEAKKRNGHFSAAG